MNEKWQKIEKLYLSAKKCLYCPNCGDWSMDEENGMYFLWSAYHEAKDSEEKDHLLYARILAMMDDKRQWYEFNLMPGKNYAKLALDEYLLAEKESPGTVPEKEMLRIKQRTDYLAYIDKHTKNNAECCENAYKLIEGIATVKGFCFHDSKPKSFEHGEKWAVLKLAYDEKLITLRFDDVFDIEVNIDPVCNWINDFYCYYEFCRNDVIVFDVGFYKITCRRISVAGCEETSDEQTNHTEE